MKTTQRFAVSAMAAAVLLALAGCGGMATRDGDDVIAVVPGSAVAQGSLPQCENANYDQVRGLFTVINPAPGTVNQQCLLTVVSTQQASASGARYPAAPFLVEGYYTVELSGGGGGGGGGAAKDGGGGGGGAGAAPFKTVKLLSPGVYKLTIGTGGEGGKPGGWTQAGNPTSLTNYNTGALIAGFEGADVWKQLARAPGSGRGGAALAGGSSGGSGGDAGISMRGHRTEAVAQSGGMLQTPGYTGAPGQAGGETGLTGRRDVVQANAGGGGGAGVGSGGAGDSPAGGAAGIGDLGGGGGGGSGHPNSADSGGRGGHGFIRLTLNQAIAQAATPAPVERAASPAPASAASTITTPAPAATRPARKDRN